MRLVDKDQLIDEVKKMWLSSENDKYKVLEYIEKTAEISLKELTEVKIGDEVLLRDRGKQVVINIDTEIECYCLLPACDWWDIDDCIKTGKHYPQIEEVLKELKNE